MVGPDTTGDRYSSHLRKLITRMLQKEPAKRPSMDDVVEYVWCFVAVVVVVVAVAVVAAAAYDDVAATASVVIVAGAIVVVDRLNISFITK